jgi:hypothetical protein
MRARPSLTNAMSRCRLTTRKSRTQSTGPRAAMSIPSSRKELGGHIAQAAVNENSGVCLVVARIVTKGPQFLNRVANSLQGYKIVDLGALS